MLIKHIIKLSDLKQFAEDDSSCIELKKVCSRRLNFLPGQFSDIKKSARENLHSVIATYDSQLDGIILNFKNVKIKPLVSLTEDINVNVDYIADIYLFRPQVGKILKGIVNKKSQDHIGCLVHKYFNATISRPDEVKFDNWSGKELNIGDVILFKVSTVNLDRRLPYIRGFLIDSDLEIKSESTSGVIDSTEQVLTPSTSSNLNTIKLTPYEKITKLLNPNFSGSDEESSTSSKRSSIKRSSTSRQLSEKEKLPFRSNQVTENEGDVDNSMVRKRRKIQY